MENINEIPFLVNIRDIKSELLEVKGGEFPLWYSNLINTEKIEYSKSLKSLGEK
tara:strand:- start:67 stop:228 length:162 start_codon:yes stop_codon:yes gene_type:complete